MKRKLITKMILIAMVLVFSLVSVHSASADQKVFKWRAQTYAVPGSVGYKALDIALKHLKEATGGRIDVKLYGVGTLVGPFDQLDALGKGIFECAFNAGGYYAGKDPAFAAFFSLIGVWDTTTDVKIWAYYFGGNDLIQQLYAKHNVHYLGPALVGAEPIMSTVPLRTLDDFKGIKIRTAGGLCGNLFSKLGASPVKMGGGQLYTGLDTKVVDAAEFVSLAENWDIGLHEVTKYVLYPSFHGPIALCDFSVNKDVWDKLPPDLQATLKTWVYELDARFDYMSSAESIKALEKMTKAGLVQTQLSNADMKKAKQLSLEVALDWKKKSPMSAKVVDSILNYLKLKGSIQ